ncbi:protein-methionine-sulfoxide reductase catalytic subunit MsrP [Parahalioglobus pacificus]|uniref:Protein-methionine-sulfoxide reductase catalytic subunit MsrP n=1 Tax=Parahalioglobus pacificus TaxID=930806 RepID=A0A919CML1_9GAMM|nr:protein-methionine-sulfoxide reductase catalytic subunit MsrP [Halioglobus pacificus]GHD37718.1 protein-methionine-sulfoxide reductase catalytic subunit MsrP [Halioglobus pacificus]
MASRFKIPHIASSEITSETAYFNRRELIKVAGMAAVPTALAGCSSAESAETPLDFAAAGDAGAGFTTSEALTPEGDVKSYCNFYEFGTDKGDPAKYASEMTTDPWSIEVDGMVNKPGKLNLEDIMGFELEERIYRFRCVEAWSMVVPWIGFPLYKLLEKFEPTSDAKYVEFRTLYRRSEMRGTRSFTNIIDWPYREGLRMDEAMHPLTLMAVGMYGKTLPNQNGAPIRLVVPWKYGFKSIKSVVQIRLTSKQPDTSWQALAASEYGFYSNVNPEVDHPRWSQRYERRLPSTLLNPNRIPTQKFNGYEEQVGALYAGMDLSKYY